LIDGSSLDWPRLAQLQHLAWPADRVAPAIATEIKKLRARGPPVERFRPKFASGRSFWRTSLPEAAKLIEDVTIDSRGRLIPKIYTKLQAGKELRAMLNIGAKERETSDVSRLSDTELIQQLADQARELGIEIDLNYTFAQRQEEPDK
jgi:hypothetical protein